MTKDAINKLVSQLVKKNKCKLDKRDMDNLLVYAYKVMNNTHTYPGMTEEEKEEHKRHAIYTMMVIMTQRGQ